MNKMKLAGCLLAMTMLSGCSGAFWGGTGAGVAGAGAGYELRARQQMERLEDDYKAGKMDEREYNIRKDQIQKGSVFY